VDRLGVLCAMDRHMMQTFSQRTAASLARHSLFGLLLPAFQSFLDINVRKEVEKDRRVLATAATALKAGGTPNAADTQRLLVEARDIDQAFLRQAAIFPVAINIHYSDIEPTRLKRIERLLDLSTRLLSAWQTTPRFRVAAATAYTREQFEIALREILHLYALETKMLSHSVRIPTLFTLARDKLTSTIYSEMESNAVELARELTSKVYRRSA
jgi:hypothetical protein